MKKKAQIHLLDTNNISTRNNMILLGHLSKVLMYEQLGTTRNDTVEPQHLYFTTDEEIKTGDWVIGNKSNAMFQIQIQPTTITSFYRKVVATTDPMLLHLVSTSYTTVEPHFSPAKISDSFIQSYIKSYNEGNIIKEIQVMVEYTTIRKAITERLLTTANGTCIIWPTETKMYTREEVLEMIINAVDNFESITNLKNSIKIWFNESYPE